MPFTVFLDFSGVPTHQHQDGSCNLGQEYCRPPPIKEEQEEPSRHQQVTVKQESDALMVTPIHEEVDQSKDPCESSETPEPDCGLRLLSISPHVAESKGQENFKTEDLGSTPDEDLTPTVKQRRRKRHPGNAENPAALAVDWNTGLANPNRVHPNPDTNATSASCHTGEEQVKVISDLTGHSPVQGNENADAQTACRKGTRGSRSSVNTRNHTGNGPFHCETCGEKFKHFIYLKQHVRIHTDERPFLCKTCGKAFKQSIHLTQHLRIHTGEKPYSCKTCGKGFTTRGPMKVHQRIHTGEKPYSCKACGKAFKQSVHLKQHIGIHTGERPFSCKTCGKDFPTPACMKVHQGIHTSEKLYSCKICGTTFKNHDSLNVHLRSHKIVKPFLCEVCGKVFKQQSKLKSHFKTHTSEKPFSCKTCGKAFKRLHHLTVHMSIHTGERPFLCKTCGKAFKISSALKRHMTIHTNMSLRREKSFRHNSELNKHVTNYSGNNIQISEQVSFEIPADSTSQ